MSVNDRCWKRKLYLFAVFLLVSLIAYKYFQEQRLSLIKKNLNYGFNHVVYFSQNDVRWSNKMYSNHDDLLQTIGTSGCAPTAMAMVISTLSKKVVYPSDLARLAVRHDFRTYNAGTLSRFFPWASSKYDLTCTEVSKVNGPNNKGQIIKALTNKQIVIVSMGKGQFSAENHIIILTGYDNHTSQALVHDPNDNNYNNTFHKPGSGIYKVSMDIIDKESLRYWIVKK